MKTLVAFFSFFFISFCFAAQPNSNDFDKWLGDWKSNGSAFGNPAVSTMTWTFDLGKKFVRLDYRIEMTPADGKESKFQGIAYYQLSSTHELSGFWADNSGDLHPINGTFKNNLLYASWGTIGTKQGRSQYEMLGKNRIQVTDWILTEDGWKQFNSNIFTRAS